MQIPQFFEIPQVPTEGRMILTLNTLGKHVYAGTVSWKVKHRRRARNKMARASRRANRGRR